MIRNEVIRRELGLTETLVNRISNRRLTWFEHVVRMEDKSLLAKSSMLLRRWKKEQRKRSKDRDGQCETRPYRKRHGLENGPGYYQRQRKLETSCKYLIVGEYLQKRNINKRKYLFVLTKHSKCKL